MLIVNSKMLYVMKIRTIVAVTALAAMALPVAAQHRCCHSVSVPDTVQCTRLQYYIDMQHQNKYTELWGQRATIFEALPVDTNDIVMLGNSLTHGCEWHELLGMPNVLNRGIIGDVIEGIRLRVDPILNGHPKKIFLLAGVNDVSHNLSADSIANAMGELIDYIRTRSPQTRLYVQSMLPINNSFGRYKNLKDKEQVIRDANVLVAAMAQDKGFTWINLYTAVADKYGNLRKDLTNDGLHLLAPGYRIWADIIRPYINE